MVYPHSKWHLRKVAPDPRCGEAWVEGDGLDKGAGGVMGCLRGTPPSSLRGGGTLAKRNFNSNSPWFGGKQSFPWGRTLYFRKNNFSWGKGPFFSQGIPKGKFSINRPAEKGGITREGLSSIQTRNIGPGGTIWKRHFF